MGKDREELRLLTPEEAAERLKVSPETIKKWCREGKLRGVKVSVLWRIRQEDLESFIQDQKRKHEQAWRDSK